MSVHTAAVERLAYLVARAADEVCQLHYLSAYISSEYIVIRYRMVAKRFDEHKN